MRVVLLIFLLLGLQAAAQNETLITGKIQDKQTKEPLPYVSIGLKGIPGGTTTNFEGRFKLQTTHKVDSIIVTYVGYKRYSKHVKQGHPQNLLIELEPLTHEMSEAVIKPGINPALRIINQARKNKKVLNQDNLGSYQYDSYSKVDLSLSNISDELKNKKFFKPLSSLFDTAYQMKNTDGKYIIPFFVSETFSKYYYLKSLGKSKEVILGSKYSGIMVEDDSYLRELTGGQLHHFNLSNNFIRILNKDFISPVADEAHFYYIYTLLDSMDIDGLKCYKIQVNLKRKQDLGFEGLVWIADSSFAIKQVVLEIGKEANVNFINKIKLHQELQPTKEKAWITTKSRLVFDFDRFSKNGSGAVAGFYNAYTNIETGIDLNESFFDYAIITSDTVVKNDTAFWDQKRTEPLAAVEKEMYHRIDSINDLPVIKKYYGIASLLVEGYKRIGKLDWGPYSGLVSFNKVEGMRYRLGFKTNYDFSKKWMISTHLAYGTRDELFKYKLGVDYFINSKRWTVLSARYRKDNDILGITNAPITYVNNNGIFQFFNFFSNHVRINRTEEVNLRFTQTFHNDWTMNLILNHTWFLPQGDFKFEYMDRFKNGGTVRNSYTNSEAAIEIRWAFKEVMISRGHDRFRMERAKYPVIVLAYGHGFNGVAGSHFNYDRLGLIVSHHMNTRQLGTADWSIYAGKTFGVLPYPLLDVARGNESFIYSENNYNLMNFYEFISDQFVHARYIQHMEGLIFNHIPYINELDLRNYFSIKAAYGSLSADNKSINPAYMSNENVLSPFYTFRNNEPYFELGYGIENIYHLASIGFVHRLNYLGHPNARRFGINFGLAVRF